jgi:hypothetical protein
VSFEFEEETFSVSRDWKKLLISIICFKLDQTSTKLFSTSRKSYSYDDESIVRQGEREGSPEIQAGVTRNSIAFFENLQKK